MTRIARLTCTAAALALALPAAALAGGDGHGRYKAGEIEWRDGPASVDPGAQFAVLQGDPTKEGLFTMRLKLPPNYTIKPHHHPAVENVTVISGEFNMASGEAPTKADGMQMLPGDYTYYDPGNAHMAWTGDQETVIQLHGIGPWQIIYVNPADDPRGTN